MRPFVPCVVCGEAGSLSDVVVEGRPCVLCRVHVAKLGKLVPRVFASYEELFALPGFDRRIEVDRRRDDRRMFPPRPELRRRNNGRRADDPR